ncbi:MAG TPA: hypothetical protein VGI81_23065 [Tepidisphaeraceae bacterium]|jgi:hypothetical protein
MPKFRCEHCRQKIAAPDDYVGRRVRCPRCKQPVQVPALAEAVAAAAPIATPTPVVAAPAEALVAPTMAPAPPPPPSIAKSESPPSQLFGPPPSAAPFLGEVQDPLVTRPVEGDLSSYFGELDARDLPDLPDLPYDLSPEEQTQTFWHLQEAAEYHEAPDRPFDGAGEFLSQPVVDEPAAGFRAGPEDAHESPGEPETVSEPEPPPAPEPVVLEPAEVIDVPVQRRRPGLNSADEVADLLRRLDKPEERARRAVEWVVDQRQRMAPRGSRWIGVFGWASVLVGLGAIGLGFLPAQARFAAPAGVGGLVLAVAGLVLALGKRARVWVPIGGTLASAGGVAVAVLVAKGYLPPSAAAKRLHPAPVSPVTLVANTRPAAPDDPSAPAPAPAPVEYVPATSPVIAKNVEVRVASALVLRPAVYSGGYASLHTAEERRLQITLELKQAGVGQAIYRPWRKVEGEDVVEAKVTDAGGTVLPLDERPYTDAEHPVPLAVGALSKPVKLSLIATPDVLLFAPPADPAGDLLLDLPGANIGAPDIILHIRIPAAMVRV